MSLEELDTLAKMSRYPGWKILEKFMESRVLKDKNSIVTLPENDPVRLATQKAFYRGRISAINLIRKEVNQAPATLEKLEEK